MLTLIILFLVFRALLNPWRWHRPWGLWYRPWGLWGHRPPMGGFGPGPRPPMGGFGGPMGGPGRGMGRF